MGLLIRIIYAAGSLLSFAIIADAILSWAPGYNQRVYEIRQFLQKITGPIMEPVRSLMRPVTERIMIDFSPVIAIFAIELLQTLLVRIVVRLF